MYLNITINIITTSKKSAVFWCSWFLVVLGTTTITITKHSTIIDTTTNIPNTATTAITATTTTTTTTTI